MPNVRVPPPGAGRIRRNKDPTPRRVVDVVRNFMPGEEDQPPCTVTPHVRRQAPEPVKDPCAYNWVFQVTGDKFEHVRSHRGNSQLVVHHYADPKCDVCGSKCKVLFVARCYPKRKLAEVDKSQGDQAKLHYDLREDRLLTEHIMYLGPQCGQNLLGAVAPPKELAEAAVEAGQAEAELEGKAAGAGDGDGDDSADADGDASELAETEEGEVESVMDSVSGRKVVIDRTRTANSMEVRGFLEAGESAHRDRVRYEDIRREQALNACKAAVDAAEKAATTSKESTARVREAQLRAAALNTTAAFEIRDKNAQEKKGVLDKAAKDIEACRLQAMEAKENVQAAHSVCKAQATEAGAKAVLAECEEAETISKKATEARDSAMKDLQLVCEAVESLFKAGDLANKRAATADLSLTLKAHENPAKKIRVR